MADVTRGLTARIIREGAGDDCVFIAEHGFYCYMTSAGTPAAVLQVVLQKAAREIASYDYENGRDFEEGVLDDLKRAGAPGGADIACVLHKHGKLFLMSRQKGEIYVQRAGNTAKLMGGDKHALGTLLEEDIFILTTSESSAAIQTLGGWNAYLGGADISGRDLSGLILTTSVVEAEEKEERVDRRAKPVQLETDGKKGPKERKIPTL